MSRTRPTRRRSLTRPLCRRLWSRRHRARRQEDLNNPDAPPPDKKELKEEVLNTAKMLGMQPNFKLLMLDTENKFVSTGVAKEIAAAAQGKYHYIPKASEKAVASVASQAISDLRN